ncbi:MAG: DUF502 domain-containing protein [Chloroflexota bacterium]|nr:DUF502 domain-containing protein [Chloroflexota bacterium]MDE3267056.1 DUF502 domain-containing protein [Chloroflexota bacterium]
MARDTESNLGRDKEERVGVLKHIDSHIQGRMVAGLVYLLPTLITIVVMLFLIGSADSLVRPLPFISGEPWDFPGIGVVVLVVLIYLVGLLVWVKPGTKLLELMNMLLSHTPIVKSVFGVSQQAVAAFASQYNFSRVVFVEWPREGMIAMGFVTGRIYAPSRDWSVVAVYIPTVPNPTSGNMAFVIENDVIETDLTVDGAMKLVFSGGIVLPEYLTLARVPRDPDTEPLRMIGRFESER